MPKLPDRVRVAGSARGIGRASVGEFEFVHAAKAAALSMRQVRAIEWAEHGVGGWSALLGYVAE